MTEKGLLKFIDILEKEGELVRIKEFVNPDLEITEIADRHSKLPGGGKALFFENTGTEFPLLINALGSEKRIALAFERENVFQLEKEIENLFKNLMQPKDTLWDKLKLLPMLKEVSQWMPKKIKGRGICQEVINTNPDLNKYPILKCWPADGGKFITLPGVHTVDPKTGTPNLGMYRMQVFEKNLTGMHWHQHKTGRNHFEEYKRLGEKMPISVALGGDMIYTYAATAPMPENFDEYLLAGFLRKKPVRLVKCVTNDLYVPEDSDIVIEGYVDPAEELIWEGPFGDHTGFYSLADWYPKFHVTCITHKKEAIYPATIVGVPPMEDAYIGLATERIFLTPIRMSMVPELKNMVLPVAGVAHNFTVVSIKKSYPGQAIKVMNSLWGAGQMMFNKILVVVDEDVNLEDKEELLKIFASNYSAENSLHFSKGPLDILDHASDKFAFGSKLGIDLTTPFPEEIQENNSELLDSDFDSNQLNEIEEIADFKCLINNIPILLLSIKKSDSYNLKKLKNKLVKLYGIESFKLILIFNEGAYLNDSFTLLWLIGGNIEPVRDISIEQSAAEKKITFVDATFKTTEHDNFKRDWPNIVTMDNETISIIDKKWESLGLGEFIESPSLRFKQLVKGGGAIRK